MTYTDVATAVTMPEQEVGLAETLRKAGLPIIDKGDVYMHITRMKTLDRPTPIYEFVHWLAMFVMVINFTIPLLWLGVKRNSAAQWGLWLSVGLGICSIFVITDSNIVTWVLTIPILAWLITIPFCIVVINLKDELLLACNFWMFYLPRSFERNEIPERIAERMEIIKKLPGVRARIQADFGDPALAAVSGYGPWREIEYIGVWNTGSTMDTI